MSRFPLFIAPLSSPDFDDGSPTVVLEQGKHGSLVLIELAAYEPGELLRRAMRQESCDCDAASIVSTIETLSSEKIESCRGNSDSDDEDQPPPKPTTSVSVGSMKHDLGLCSPCSFFYRGGGCSEGAECTFCHLCPPGSIELKRKMKRKLVKSLKQANKLACA